MELPTLDQSVEQLKAVTGRDEFDPDAPLPRSGVDSLDLVEWLDAFQNRYPDIAVDETVLEYVDDTVTFRDLHDRIVNSQTVAAASSAGGGS